jgi:hypothetical protein
VSTMSLTRREEHEGESRRGEPSDADDRSDDDRT